MPTLQVLTTWMVRKIILLCFYVLLHVSIGLQQPSSGQTINGICSRL